MDVSFNKYSIVEVKMGVREIEQLFISNPQHHITTCREPPTCLSSLAFQLLMAPFQSRNNQPVILDPNRRQSTETRYQNTLQNPWKMAERRPLATVSSLHRLCLAQSIDSGCDSSRKLVQTILRDYEKKVSHALRLPTATMGYCLIRSKHGKPSFESCENND